MKDKTNIGVSPVVMRHEIWLANIPASGEGHVQHGPRPVLIVSNNLANTYSPVVTIVPLTTQMNKHHLPTHVFLRDQGLSKNSLALCEQIITLDKIHRIRRIGYVHKSFDQYAIRHALAVQLDIAS